MEIFQNNNKLNIDVKSSIEENKELISELTQVFCHYHSARSKWARRAREYQVLADNDVDGTGTQFTQQELDELKKRYGIPLSINILHAALEHEQAFLSANKPTVVAVPIGTSSKHFSYVARELIKATFDCNNHDTLMEMVIRDAEIAGHGLIYVGTNDFYTNNYFNVTLKHLPWIYTYFDPNSKQVDYQDSEYIFISIPITKHKARLIYGLTEEEINTATEWPQELDSTLGNTWTGTLSSAPFFGSSEKTKLVWLQEIFKKINVTGYVMDDGQIVFSKPESSVISSKGNIASFTGQTVPVPAVQKMIRVGNIIKTKVILPVKDYPIAVFKRTHSGHPFDHGMVHYVVDIQYTLNNVLAHVTEGLQKSTSSGWVAPAGSIDDKSEFQIQISTPGGVAEYTPDPSLPNGGKPEQSQPSAINTAAYTLFHDLIKLAEYITGIFDLVRGSAENAPQTLGATNSIQSYAGLRFKMYARRIDKGNEKLADICLQFLQSFAPEANVIRYLQGTETMMEIITNAKVNVMKDGSFEENEITGEIATIIRNLADDKAVAILGNLKDAKYFVRFVTSNDLPTTRMMVAQFLQSLLGRVSDDSTGLAILKMMLEIVDYPEVDKLLRDVDVIERLKQQVNELAGELQKQKQENLKIENKLVDSRIKAREAQVVAGIEKVKSKVDTEVNKIKEDVKEVNKEQKQKSMEEYS